MTFDFDLDLGERVADCGCCTIVDSIALGNLKECLEEVQAALDFTDDPREISCGGLNIYDSGCFAGDLDRRVKTALPKARYVPTFKVGDFVEVELVGDWVRGLITGLGTGPTFHIAVVGRGTLAYGNPAFVKGAEKFLRYPSEDK